MGQKPVIHGNSDHRPPGWNSATDPGGADPLTWLTATPSSGIRFDTFPQTGGWLHVLTDGSTGSDSDGPGGLANVHLANTGPYGIQIEDSSVQGIKLYTNDATALEDAGVLMFVNQISPGNYRAVWYLKTDPNDNTRVENFGEASDYSWKISDTTSGAFTIQNHLNAAIFQVHEDGTIHGLTGGSITWDL